MACSVAQGGQYVSGSLRPQITGKKSRFKVFEGLLVYRSGEGDEVFDFGRQGLACARDGLLHAAKKAGSRRGGRSCRGVCFGAKELHRQVIQIQV